MTKTSEQGQKLLEFVTRRFEETQRPLTTADMAEGPVPGAVLRNVRAALVAKGLLRVTDQGFARWLPGHAVYVPREEEVN